MALCHAYRCLLLLGLFLPSLGFGQEADRGLPESKDWFKHRIEWLRQSGGRDSTAAYQTLDSLTRWVDRYGSENDKDWLNLSRARFLMAIDRHPQALVLLDSMLKVSADPNIHAHTLLTLRDLHDELEAYDEAIQFHEMIQWEDLPQLHESKTPSSFIAFTYAKLGIYDQAISSIKRSIKELRAADQHYFEVSYTNSLGIFFLHSGYLDSALSTFQTTAERLERYFPEGQGMNAENYRFFQGLIKGNMAQVLAEQGKHYEAIPLLKADIAASLQGEPPYAYRDNGIKSMVHLSKSYIATGQLDLAEACLAKAKALEQRDDPAENRIAWLQTKARLLRAQGKHEQAFTVLERAEAVEDSASLVSKNDRANNLLKTYRYSLDREIMERSEEVARLRQMAEQQRRFNWVFIGLISLALFTSIYFTVLYRQNKARRKDLEVKNQQIQQQKSMLEEALNEQEVLLREVNHRVKNNLQVISSMLFLEQRKLTDASIKQALRDVQERIRTMSNIHQKLYMRHQTQGDELLFEHYVKDLVEGIINSYVGEEKDITLTHHININQLPVDQTIPLSLILHELATNSVKHAFHNERSGNIHIEVEHIHEEGKSMILLRYSDNGSGLQENHLEWSNATTIGMKLIELLTHQLRGKISMKNQHGFHCEISFPSQSAQPTFAA